MEVARIPADAPLAVRVGRHPFTSLNRASQETPPVDRNSETVNRARLELENLENRETPSIVLVNPAGNTPQSESANNGEAIVAVNPAGNVPPGHNK
jgi:hypothetical protein